MRPGVIWAVAGVTLLAVALAVGAPWISAEYLLRNHGALIGARSPQPVRGHWFDDYFLIEAIDSSTFAIGEPRYYQGNYSYLLLGSKRALLFDAGTGNRDIVPVVRSLTSLPVTVMPSHLHFDHVGALGHFEETALIDLRSLRERLHNRRLTLGRYEFLGFADSLPEPTLGSPNGGRLGSTIELGGRTVRVLSTPGHTPSSAALYDAQRRQLFAGDFIYPGTLYAFLPGASRSDYLNTARKLLAALDPATRIYAAHMADKAPTISAPVLEMADLYALEHTLARIKAGGPSNSGFYPRIYSVRGPITFASGYAWNNH